MEKPFVKKVSTLDKIIRIMSGIDIDSRRLRWCRRQDNRRSKERKVQQEKEASLRGQIRRSKNRKERDSVGS